MKEKYPRAEALEVARRIYDILKPFTERCKVAGSLRRGCKEVSDIEFVFIPKMAPDPSSMFGALFGVSEAKMIDLTALAIDRLRQDGDLTARPNVKGVETWGPQIKLARDTESGIPIDFFSTTHEKYWNCLVCRTGSLASNLRLTQAALKMGWSFEAFGSGFRKLHSREYHHTTSEEDVFSFVGLPCLPPEKRR